MFLGVKSWRFHGDIMWFRGDIMRLIESDWDWLGVNEIWWDMMGYITDKLIFGCVWNWCTPLAHHIWGSPKNILDKPKFMGILGYRVHGEILQKNWRASKLRTVVSKLFGLIPYKNAKAPTSYIYTTFPLSLLSLQIAVPPTSSHHCGDMWWS